MIEAYLPLNNHRGSFTTVYGTIFFLFARGGTLLQVPFEKSFLKKK